MIVIGDIRALCFITILIFHFFFHPDEARHMKSDVSTPVYPTRTMEGQCGRGNPIDDCWRCHNSTWDRTPKRLAACAHGFAWDTKGGSQGKHYVVTSAYDDPADPRPGTLRHAVIQTEAVWITFATDMVVHLKAELLVGSVKTIDGRGADVHVTGYGCIMLQNVAHVIIHGIRIRNCKRGGPASVALSPGQVAYGDYSDGDGITVYGSRNVWIDHCSISSCDDGLIDVIRNSTAVTISNCHFSNHDKVMLLGAGDEDESESWLHVTVAFNHFGENLGQRMPRCRRGHFHILNNYYSSWSHYAIGGTAHPSILSQGNVYVAPDNKNKKEVTYRGETQSDWAQWNWLSMGDELDNGAFFTPSGSGDLTQYKSSMGAKPASQVLSLTAEAGVLRCWRGEYADCVKA